MTGADKFEYMAEYTLALLQLLNSEGPLATQSALSSFERMYKERIPESMYGIVGKDVKWSNRVRWERLSLRRLRLGIMNAPASWQGCVR